MVRSPIPLPPAPVMGIAATATGSSGITFSINGGAFQNVGELHRAGCLYTITAKMEMAARAAGPSPWSRRINVRRNDHRYRLYHQQCALRNYLNRVLRLRLPGGSGSFTYSIDAGSFQSSNVFSNLASARTPSSPKMPTAAPAAPILRSTTRHRALSSQPSVR